MIQTTNIVNFEYAQAWLAPRLSPERYAHSIGAREKAAELAEKFQLPFEQQQRAALAGLLHDAAKLMSPDDLLTFCQERDLPLDEVDRQTPQTLHPFVGAELVREAFDLQDDDVLNAIRYHTTGRAGMSVVEKLVYIADKIEGNTRNPLYIQRVTANLDYRKPWSLDLTTLYVLDSTMQFLMDKHQVIHPRTLEARNDLVVRLKADHHL